MSSSFSSPCSSSKKTRGQPGLIVHWSDSARTKKKSDGIDNINDNTNANANDNDERQSRTRMSSPSYNFNSRSTLLNETESAYGYGYASESEPEPEFESESTLKSSGRRDTNVDNYTSKMNATGYIDDKRTDPGPGPGEEHPGKKNEKNSFKATMRMIGNCKYCTYHVYKNETGWFFCFVLLRFAVIARLDMPSLLADVVYLL